METLQDSLNNTWGLSTEQIGAYYLLLTASRINGGIPNNDKILQQITRLSAYQWKKHKPVLASYFNVTSTNWQPK
ncbi:DUF1376 domain-containing protein [Deefgea sp. CFH1-16]|uniref:DUF1376 domain-containing protein n=1 Tax=Deefgea sp. CFH1-16 TaxID=2675457 RepID=UPI0015F43624|nr:DUF1376 domain-containing protein [Deefgea sp. CFH1-16]MBM5573035.1 DUF1376 domain-containing protein [Deefgea sp. CFH1-16]